MILKTGSLFNSANDYIYYQRKGSKLENIPFIKNSNIFHKYKQYIASIMNPE